MPPANRLRRPLARPVLRDTAPSRPPAARLRRLLASACLGFGLLAGQAEAAVDPATFQVWNLDFSNNGTPDVWGRLFVPAAATQNPGQTYPLVIFYHGQGERGSNNLSQINNNIENLWLAAQANNFFIYAPQLPSSYQGWDEPFVDDTLRALGGAMAQTQYNIDPSRIYVTGLSLGGGAVRYIMGRYADVYGAAFPICGVGGGAPGEIGNAVGKPVWMFHAQDDGPVDVDYSRDHVNAIRAADGNLPPLLFRLNEQPPTYEYYNTGAPYYSPSSGHTYYELNGLRYTEYGNGDHYIWGRAYGEAPLYEWMLQQSCFNSLALQQSVYFDFGPEGYTSTDSQNRVWNSTNHPVNYLNNTFHQSVNAAVIPFAKLSDGHRSSVCLTVLQPFLEATAGWQGSASSLFPDPVGRDGWVTAQNATEASGAGAIRVHGLVPGATYEVQIFATHAFGDGNNSRSSRYKIGEAFADLEVKSNTANVATIANVIANAKGAFDLKVFPTPGTTSRYGQINTLSVKMTAGPGGSTNVPPVANDDTASTLQNEAVDVDVLGNDADSDGPSALTVSGVTQPAHGTASVVNNQVRYTPANDYVGTDSFTYTASDGAATATASVSVTVNEPNTPPSVHAGTDQSVVLPAMGPVVVALNGTVTDEGTPAISWSVEQAPAGASANFANAASEDTTVSLNAVGSYVLKLTADDGVNAPESDTVEITVQEAPPTGGNGVVLFSQNFDSSSAVSSYVNATGPGFGVFNDISPVNAAAGFSIVTDTGSSNQRLQLKRTPATGLAGFMRHTNIPEAVPSLVKVEFDLQISGYTAWNALMELSLGDYSSFIAYNGWIPGAQRTASLIAQQISPTSYHIRLSDDKNAPGGQDYIWSGPISTAQPARIAWYVNTSGSTQAYWVGTESFLLAHRQMALWVNGQQQIVTDVPTSWFVSDSVSDLRAVFFQDGTYQIDNLSVTDVLRNGGPTPQADTAATLQGVPVDIDVLANDGPGLTLTAVASPDQGMASMVDGLVRYVPPAGYSGTAQFTYTVSNGSASGTAPVTVNIAAAGGLPPASGLTGLAIGSGALGSSRVVNTDQWEINGSGSGLAGTADSFYSEAAGVPGDFRVLARIHNLVSGGAAPRAGIMIRESDQPGARMIALATANTGTSYKLLQRAAADTASTETSVASPAYAYPNAWVMLERVGDIVSAAVSDDGVSFTDAGSVTVAGLGSTVNVGVFASSGTAGVNAKAIVTDFDILPAATAFTQNFDSSTTLASYINASAPNTNAFNDISSGDGQSWSITTGGALQLSRTGTTGLAGFTRHTNLPGVSSAGGLVVVEFDLQVTEYTAWSALMELSLGDYSSFIAYNGWIPGAQRTASLVAQQVSPTSYHIRLSDDKNAPGPEYVWSGNISTSQPARIAWYVNTTGTTQDYRGPAGEGPYPLAHRQMALWVNGQRQIVTEVPTNWFTSNSVADFRAVFYHNATFRIDNLSITNLLAE